MSEYYYYWIACLLGGLVLLVIYSLQSKAQESEKGLENMELAMLRGKAIRIVPSPTQ